MECPKWLEELMNNIAGCFETMGELGWTWREEEGDFEITMFPEVIMINGIAGLDGDIRLSVTDALSYFDDDPDLQWHLSGSKEGAFHIEGTVNGVAVWISFVETPPDDVPAGMLDDEDPDSDTNVTLN